MNLISQNIAYSPILRAKLGEFTALAEISPEVWKFMLPLLVVPPFSDFDHEVGRVLTPSEQIKHFGPRLADSCGKYPVAVDAYMLDEPDQFKLWTDHPLTALIQRARTAGANALPVTSLGRSSKYQTAVRRILELDRQGGAIRLYLADILDPALALKIEDALKLLNAPASDFLLYIDFQGRSFEPEDVQKLSNLLIEKISELPRLLEWRAVYVAASEFPTTEKLRTLGAGAHEYYPRGEWALWKHLQTYSGEIPRRILFSDYGIDNPEFTPTPPKCRPSVQLRYTTDRGTLIGKSPPNMGYAGIKSVCDVIRGSGHYSGDNFSFGDRFIARCADGHIKPGGPSTWRGVGTSHHVTKIVRDLTGSNLSVATHTRSDQAQFSF